MATAASPTSSLYEVLGLPMSASGHEIKAAYRRLARRCHPDVVAMNQKQTSATEFMKIHAAYATLSDPEKRANYDRGLYRCARPFGSSSSLSSATAAAANTYRNWETDQCW
ncbi:putative DnaJ domain-containing protein [Rosa chinensis]|uniref:Putative DnaJ domain-containing protein n=2 Tax=Rosa chinensis TaxID=74649 RepID=A0A2P6PIZ2_ROSCH|nr:putative DnaJ domain-containing protein [Rosa chinensis]